MWFRAGTVISDASPLSDLSPGAELRKSAQGHSDRSRLHLVCGPDRPGRMISAQHSEPLCGLCVFVRPVRCGDQVGARPNSNPGGRVGEPQHAIHSTSRSAALSQWLGSTCALGLAVEPSGGHRTKSRTSLASQCWLKCGIGRQGHRK